MTPRSPLLDSDAHPVKPGTSAALTARTIDATPPSTLALAQQAVSDITSKANLTAPSSAFLYTIGFTFVMTWFAAQKLHIRASAVVASALMLIPLSSFHPSGTASDSQPKASYVASNEWVQQHSAVNDEGSSVDVQQEPQEKSPDDSDMRPSDDSDGYMVMPAMPAAPEVPAVPEVALPEVMPSDDVMPSPERIPTLSPELVAKIRNSEALARIEEERMRLMLERLNYRLRREAKKRQ